MDMFAGSMFILLYIVGGIFLLLWPFLIWSHLREHTRYLKEIRDLLQKGS